MADNESYYYITAGADQCGMGYVMGYGEKRAAVGGGGLMSGNGDG
jgi:hypothetical protein